MVINRFSEARGIFETDEFSVEPCMYCFGDDGGGGGGGNSGADDFGFSDDTIGGYSGASDIGGTEPGGGGNDNDNQPSPAVNPGNIGVGSGAGLGATSNANFSPGPAPSAGGSDPFDMDAAVDAYIDQAITNFGVGPTVGVMPDPFAEAVSAGTAVPGPSVGGGDAESAVTEFNIFDTPEFQDMQSRLAEQQAAAERDRILGIASSAMTQDDVYNMFGGPGPGSTAPVSMAPAPRPSAQGEVVPGFGASVDRAISDFMGETYGGITEQLPDGTISKELFTDLGDFVSQPTDFLSAYSPVAQQRMQEGYLADYGLEIPNIEVFGQKIPISVVGAAVNAIANPEYTMTQALRQGAAPVYGTLPGQEGSILGATSPSGDIVYSNAPFGDSLAALKGTFGFGPGLDPNMEAAYARQRELDDAERARNDSGDQAAPPALTLPDPVTEECPEGYTRDGSGVCVYEGQPRVGVTPYTPMAPVEFSYTGLPSLAPRTLTPTAPNLSFLNRR